MTTDVYKIIPPSNASRAFALAGALGMAGVCGVAWYFDPTTDGIFPPCPFYTLTGYACPGCGMTRGLHALLHGHVLTALDYNLILPGIVFFFGYLFVSLVLVAARGRGLDFKIFTPRVLTVFFVAAFVFTILRNLPYYPFNILFP
ncbi:MAG: DUF2752 domain-containing protein [Acidobacteria bacterium]|nr:DUF2752 domain-containing protein [Acidobacteriota bacterium]